jgi:hypothetical protein
MTRRRPDAGSARRDQKQFVRTRPRLGSGTRARQFELVRNLLRDSRMSRLTPGARHALTVAAHEWANSGGGFFVKIETWATAAGLSARTVQRAVRAAQTEGLLEVVAYLRPHAAGQGASNYQFDVALLPRSAPDTPARGDIQSARARGDTGAAPERSSNVKQNAPLILEECMRCSAPGPCTDDGARILCLDCRAKESDQGEPA